MAVRERGIAGRRPAVPDRPIDLGVQALKLSAKPSTWPLGRLAVLRPSSFRIAGSRRRSSLGRPRCPIHSSSGFSEFQDAAELEPSIWNTSEFLRPGLSWEMVTAPRAPPS